MCTTLKPCISYFFCSCICKYDECTLYLLFANSDSIAGSTYMMNNIHCVIQHMYLCKIMQVRRSFRAWWMDECNVRWILWRKILFCFFVRGGNLWMWNLCGIFFSVLFCMINNRSNDCFADLRSLMTVWDLRVGSFFSELKRRWKVLFNGNFLDNCQFIDWFWKLFVVFLVNFAVFLLLKPTNYKPQLNLNEKKKQFLVHSQSLVDQNISRWNRQI